MSPRFPSAVLTPAQVDAYAGGERAIFDAIQAEHDERDRGRDMLNRSARREGAA